MFDQIEEDNKDLFLNAIKSFKIIHHCCKCGRKVFTYWDERENFFNGDFLVLDSFMSPLLNIEVFDPRGIVCDHCFIKRSH